MEVPDATQAALGKALEATALRHQALSENIANANTPGYQRRDVRFADQLALALREGRDAVEAVEPEVEADPMGVVQVDANGVDIDVEAAELAANGMLYQALATAKRARGAIVKSALGVH